MRMSPAEYLRVRARAVLEGELLPKSLDQDWRPFVEMTRPQGSEWLDSSLDDAEVHCLRLCLAAASAEDE